MVNKADESMNPFQYFSDHLERIEETLRHELELYSWSKFYTPLRYACEKGKRIRPLILALSAESVGRCNDNAYLAATAIELLHTESIIHDDIIDGEHDRRGKVPFYIKYGYNMSILTADFVLGMILNITARINEQRAAQELANASLRMSEGEMLEIKLESGSRTICLEDYIKVLTFKTASLFEASARIGAILGGGTEEQIDALTRFGRSLGIAYQIEDDIRDWKKENKLFNLLANNAKEEFIESMHKLYLNYAKEAREELRVCNDNSRLNYLIDLTMAQIER